MSGVKKGLNRVGSADCGGFVEVTSHTEGRWQIINIPKYRVLRREIENGVCLAELPSGGKVEFNQTIQKASKAVCRMFNSCTSIHS